MFIGVIIDIKYKDLHSKRDYSDEKESVMVCYQDNNGILTKRSFSLVGHTDAQYYHIGDILVINEEEIEHLSLQTREQFKGKVRELKEAISEHKGTLSEDNTTLSDRIDTATDCLGVTMKKLGSENSHTTKL